MAQTFAPFLSLLDASCYMVMSCNDFSLLLYKQGLKKCFSQI